MKNVCVCTNIFKLVNFLYIKNEFILCSEKLRIRFKMLKTNIKEFCTKIENKTMCSIVTFG